ncbi:MAG: protein translocase subunit SecF [Coriobacteriia bacterium]|nr:protein translocase subunit SecF [Coriobacteriia bacterium]
MRLRPYFFALSAVLIVVSIGSLAIRGLQFGIDFNGGSSVTISDGGGHSIEDVRAAFIDAGMDEPIVQTVRAGDTEGFIVKSTLADEAASTEIAQHAASELNIDNYAVSIVGAGWGRQLTNSALLALALSIAAIFIYIAFRFEYKMSIVAVGTLFHDIIITLGIYSLSGREVTPATIAGLLAVLGYSLYDTVVLFGRIKENTARLTKMSFMAMANRSVNEVFMRSLNTTLTSLTPVVVMLVVNVEALNGFAFALAVGLIVGAYSSIGVAAPAYAMWKEREPKYAALRGRGETGRGKATR